MHATLVSEVSASGDEPGIFPDNGINTTAVDGLAPWFAMS